MALGLDTLAADGAPMHQLGPIDILVIIALFAVALVVERALKGRLHWLEAPFWPLIGMWRESHPTPARGVQEDDDARWSWTPEVEPRAGQSPDVPGNRASR
jgi:hypothetical protein